MIDALEHRPPRLSPTVSRPTYQPGEAAERFVKEIGQALVDGLNRSTATESASPTPSTAASSTENRRKELGQVVVRAANELTAAIVAGLTRETQPKQ